MYSILSHVFQYKKEEYVILPDRIQRLSGGIFSDAKTELLIKNITEISLVLPFMEHTFFGTGQVKIQSAGSGFVEIAISSIDHPEKIYRTLEQLMKQRGFQLSKKQLLQQERPKVMGIFFDVLTFFIGGLFLFWFIVIDNASSFLGEERIIFLSILFLLFFIPYTLLRFVDEFKRVYSIYADVITYTEGFLTTHYSCIPVQNLSDTSVTQSPLDRFLGLYDVKLSCQGIGQDIEFSHMANGKIMEQTISSLIVKKQQLQKDEGKWVNKRMDVWRTFIPFAFVMMGIFFLAMIIFFLSPFFGMEKTLLSISPTIFFLSIFLFGTSLLSSLVIYIGTSYTLKAKSIASRFNFIKTSSIEFSNDLITGVSFKESIIDKMFNTMSITFWSLGSAREIIFANIKKDDALTKTLLKQFSFTSEKKTYEILPSVSFSEFLNGHVYLTSLVIASITSLVFAGIMIDALFFLLIVFIFICVIVSYWYYSIYYRRTKMNFYSKYIHYHVGLLVQSDYFFTFDNVKGITTVHYPFSSRGSLSFSIAGERTIKRGKQTQNISNTVTMNYVKHIDEKDDIIDCMLMKKNIEKAKTMYEEKPALANTLSVLIPLLFIIALLVLIAQLFFHFSSFFVEGVLFFSLLYVIICVVYVKMRSYHIDTYRVVAQEGIIYRSQTSIVFKKINYLSHYQGFLNKLFSNGSLTVNTLASSTTEMIIADIPRFKRFYDILKKEYNS